MRNVAAWMGGLLVILALAVLPLLAPPVVHAALDAASSAELLGVPSGRVHDLSDRSVSELVLGPGTFAFDGPDGVPFYDAQERGHLADARALLWLCLVVGAVSALGLALALALAPAHGRSLIWRQVSRAGATAVAAVVVLAALSLLAFGTLFTVFHQVFFPGGGWSFDATTQRLVQLYPFAFWQIMAAAYGSLVLGIGFSAWLLGRRLSRRPGPLPSAVRNDDPARPIEGR